MIKELLILLRLVLIQPSVEMAQHLLSNATIKFILATIVYIVSLIYDNQLAAFVMIFLIITDSVTGIGASLTRGEKLQSRKLRKTAIKLFFYALLVAVMFQLENIHFIFKWLQLDNLMISYLAATEAFSNVENICTITKLKYPTWISDKLSSFIETGKFEKPTNTITIEIPTSQSVYITGSKTK